MNNLCPFWKAVLRGRNGFRGAYDASALFACWFWEFVIVMLVEIDGMGSSAVKDEADELFYIL